MRVRETVAALRFAAYLQFGAPRPPAADSIGLPERLAMVPKADMPLEHPVTIRWSPRQVPFIEAAGDRDLAVALGLVHAHLRLGQMEMMRRIAYGRVSEMVGAAAVELDRTLRILDLPRAVPEIERRLPEETRTWLAGFVAGVNHVLRHAERLPHDFALFALDREPWTVADILTLGRLAGADFMWLVWQRLLPALGAADPELWRKLAAAGTATTPGMAAGPLAAAAEAAAFGANNRSGSNSFAVSGARAGRPAAWIASDPHLGLSLPNTWLLAGYRSPGHHAAGLMIPGVPFVALGRNPWIAWGGTSLHAFASELVDVTDLTAGDTVERPAEIAVRWRGRHRLAIRETPAGPLLSDSRFFRADGHRLALRWVGHRPTDEFTAMLTVNRARNWAGFAAALDDFAVPGQTMVYADATGEIGKVMAAHIPEEAARLAVSPVQPDRGKWVRFLRRPDLPGERNPPRGYVVSANDRPPEGAPVVGHLFSSDDRRDRIAALLEDAPAVTMPALAAIQQDVAVSSARGLATKLAAAARRGRRRLALRAARLLAAVEGWDGRYDTGSTGAAAFERLLFHFARAFYPPPVLAVYTAAWTLRDLIMLDVEAASRSSLDRAAARALAQAAKPGRLPSWGELHRLRLRHPLGSIPVLGRRYRYFDLPAGGSSETVMKTAHGLIAGRHAARYGANARHISDLADPDENHFVLLGGQDGWFGSTSFADQVALWRDGKYLRIPLRPETVQAEHPFEMRLVPGRGPAD